MTLALSIVSILLLAQWQTSSAVYQLMENYPAPNTDHNRVIGFILAFNHQHIDPLTLIIGEYVSMCEGGWWPTMVLHTTVHFTDTMMRYLREKTWCYRTQSSFPVIIDYHKPKVGTGLAAFHRKVLGRELYNHDVFVYHEDDILFKYSHLMGYLNETKLLHQLLPSNGLYDNTIGFQRYRRLRRADHELHNPYYERDIFEQDLLEEMPSFDPICIGTIPYLRVGGNIHQAMWVFTQQQVLMLQDKCRFLNQSSASR